MPDQPARFAYFIRAYGCYLAFDCWWTGDGRLKKRYRVNARDLDEAKTLFQATHKRPKTATSCDGQWHVIKGKG